ncbi:unnamed protein product [Didymodactylos carnosus]|uniref:uracil phosphoribosyltransferase n=2 Tax=Didymodactylos carnosus TaxID=1234261 RepID=A0A8S2EE43_9BILA|nr:unnamed protein product [Didymodactylos carnosus]CAF3906176.1 unnamed protein product [Didymodactylos carnosus]
MDSQLNLCGISIVRAGESMEFGLRSLIPDIPIGKILIQRDEFTQNKQAKLFYTKLPMNITQAKQIFLMDPMLATGGSCILAIKTLIKFGVTIQQITFINLIACHEGLERVYAKYPQLKIVTSFVDQGLNENCYILPGIGDYGDRYFDQLHPLVDQINEVAEKIHNLKIEHLTKKAYEDLDQWRTDIHKLTDDIYSMKRKEIEQIVEINEASFVKHKNEQTSEIGTLKLDVEHLITEDDATADQIEILKSSLQTIGTNLATFQKQFITVNTRVLDSDLVRIKSDLNTNMENVNINQEQQGKFMQEVIEYAGETNNNGKPSHTWKQIHHRYKSIPYQYYIARVSYDTYLQRWDLRRATELNFREIQASEIWLRNFIKHHKICSQKTIKLVTIHSRSARLE